MPWAESARLGRIRVMAYSVCCMLSGLYNMLASKCLKKTLPAHILLSVYAVSARQILYSYISREKERYLTQSYDKSPYTNKNLKQTIDNTKTPPTTSITQRLQTDLPVGRSVGVITAIKPMWLNRLTGTKPSN